MPPNPTTSQEALAQLQQFQSGRQSAGDIISGAQAKLGIPAAQQQVGGLRTAITNTTNLLNQVAPGVMGRTGNSLVTAGQANRIIQNEQAPIAEQLRTQGQQYGEAQADLGNLNTQASQQAQAEINDQSTRMQYLQSIYDALYGREQDAAKMAEQKRQFDAQLAASRAASSGLANLFNNNNAPTPAPTSNTPTDPLGQLAYNDVRTRIGNSDDAALVSDYKATLQSANYGNPKDQAKVKFYQQLRPDLFLPVGKQYARYFMATPTVPLGPPKIFNPGLPNNLTKGLKL